MILSAMQDWTWAGLGGFLLGVGAVFSGIAAYKSAKHKRENGK